MLFLPNNRLKKSYASLTLLILWFYQPTLSQAIEVKSTSESALLCNMLEKRQKNKNKIETYISTINQSKIKYTVNHYGRTGKIKLIDIPNTKSCLPKHVENSDFFIYQIINALITGNVDKQIKAMSLGKIEDYVQEYQLIQSTKDLYREYLASEHLINVSSKIYIEEKQLTIFIIDFIMPTKEIEKIAKKYFEETGIKNLKHGVKGFSDEIFSIEIQAKQTSNGEWYTVPYTNYDLSVHTMFIDKPWLTTSTLVQD